MEAGAASPPSRSRGKQQCCSPLRERRDPNRNALPSSLRLTRRATKHIHRFLGVRSKSVLRLGLHKSGWPPRPVSHRLVTEECWIVRAADDIFGGDGIHMN